VTLTSSASLKTLPTGARLLEENVGDLTMPEMLFLEQLRERNARLLRKYLLAEKELLEPKRPGPFLRKCRINLRFEWQCHVAISTCPVASLRFHAEPAARRSSDACPISARADQSKGNVYGNEGQRQRPLGWIDRSFVRRYCQTTLKTIPLRNLLREPVKVKRLTRSGQSVQVTDNGKPLWVIQPAAREEDDEERARAIDELLEDALRAPRSKVSLSEVLDKDRR
jgi:hypothetical protein